MTNLTISAECIAAKLYEDLTSLEEEAIQDLALNRMASTPKGRKLAAAFDQAAETISDPADPMYRFIESAYAQELDNLSRQIIRDVAIILFGKACTPPGKRQSGVGQVQGESCAGRYDTSGGVGES